MKKVYIETFGCQMNVSDTERVLTKLSNSDFQITQDESVADVILFNTCSVREKAEHKLFTRIGQVCHDKPEKPLVGVLGCVAQLEGENLFDRSPNIDFVLGTRAVGRVTEIIEDALLTKEKISDLDEREFDYEWSVKENQRSSPYVAFVPIIEGCNKFCTYCIVPFSRGREKSLPATEIVKQVKILRDQGVKEVHLIGQNVNSYRPQTEEGMEKFRGATPFSKLLRAVAATGIKRVKFTTSFPRDFHTDIVGAINEYENLCNWVHLPVQSGSNRILRAMRRGHTIENYKARIDAIKNSDRQISITTDLIIGFPGETDVDFQDSLDLINYCLYDSAYIFKYSPRPGTPAYDLPDDVTPLVKKERFMKLERLQKFNQRDIYRAYIGKTIEVLAEKPSQKNSLEFSGHTSCHKVVNFKSEKDISLGDLVPVKILEDKSNTLFGVAL